MPVVKVVIIAVIGWACHFVAAQEKLALLSAAVWECYNQVLESLVMTSTNSIRLAEEHPVTTESTLLLVYTKCIVIWN